MRKLFAVASFALILASTGCAGTAQGIAAASESSTENKVAPPVELTFEEKVDRAADCELMANFVLDGSKGYYPPADQTRTLMTELLASDASAEPVKVVAQTFLDAVDSNAPEPEEIARQLTELQSFCVPAMDPSILTEQ